MPVGARTVTTNGGGVTLRANGRPLEVHDTRNGMVIHHALTGSQQVTVVRTDGTRISYERGRPGFVSRPYNVHGYSFDRRTYAFNGRVYDRYYRPYTWHGVALDFYVPGRYYPLAYYGWAYRPWAFPVHYGWRYRGEPWYGFYGGYFSPYSVYYSPSLWLTDYLFSQSLEEAYAEQQAGGYPGGPYTGPALSPDVKQQVSEEVQGEIAIEDAEAGADAQQQAPDPASSGLAALFSDGRPHVFVAGREVDVLDGAGRECAITEGDVVELTTPPGPNDTAASVQVLSSKGGADCPVMASVGISLGDLQEMQNYMRATVDQGLAQLQSEQGRDGLPSVPAGAVAAPVAGFEAQGAPPPDPAVAEEINSQAQLAQTTDQQFTAQAAANASAQSGQTGSGQTVSLQLGQSFADVNAALGAPTQVINLGQKTIYVYPSTKVTFVNGQVTDIQ